ncbi:MAG: cell wall metabolism sensor histidine kinase WalK, partial [Oscillospiraceae bacterium]|nr:cell wall metabolism sensor histidine kinase WalK [Oscillospiraceae bacterium]
MFRTLYIKLVLILILLIVSLMAVVGVFLVNGVTQFYMDEFSRQMADAFNDNRNFAESLHNAAESGAAAVSSVALSSSAILGIDGRERFVFVLDGHNGRVLAGPAEHAGRIDLTPNVLAALGGRSGYELTLADRIFDCAVPLENTAGDRYIVYIYDSRESLRRLTASLVTIVVEAVIFGLAISIMLALLLSKTMTTPIENLTRSASSVADGDFTRVPESESSDEIGVLTRTFSHMARVLRETLEEAAGERDKFGTLFQHMTDGMIAFTRDGALLHINPAAIRLLGLKEEDGSADFQSLLGDVASPDELAGLSPPGYVEKNAERGGSHFRVFFAPFGGFGPDDQGGIMAVIHDITEQARLDSVRREFVSNVSHELRTPLTNVLSYAEALADDEGLPPDTVRSFAGVIVGEAGRMTRIVQDLLTLSKFDYGKMDWRISRVDFAALLPGVRQAMLMDAGRRGLSLRLELGADLPAIYGDRERLEQVVFNILSNALSYTPEGGDVLISARHEDGQIVIRVADTGVGIS